MKEWQFNVLFFVGIGGAITLLFGPTLGLQFEQDPTAIAGIGAILSYVLTQKKKITKDEDPPPKRRRLTDHLDEIENIEDLDRIYQDSLKDLDDVYNKALQRRLEQRLEEDEED